MEGSDHLDHRSRILDYVSDAVIATDENFVITAWNRGAERLYGWTAEEVLGRSTIDLLKARAPAAADAEIPGSFGAAGEWRGEVVHRRKDGSEVMVEASIMVLAEGPTGIVSVNRDITEMKRAMVAQERNRLARELHDSVSQALFSMTLEARALELAVHREGCDPDGRVAGGVSHIRELTHGALAEMRALIFELRPGALAEEGLGPALQKSAAALEAREGITAEVTLPPDRVTLSPEAEEHLYRLAQEAFNNVAKHAGAGVVRVRLAMAGPGTVELEISDDGTGFDPVADRPGHLGLRTMADRAAALGGHLEVTSAPGGGTTIRALVPSVSPARDPS